MDPIDQVRMQFYEKIIDEEKAKEQKQSLLERNCAMHRYTKEIPSLLDGYRRFVCELCGRTTLRRANTSKKRNAMDACHIF